MRRFLRAGATAIPKNNEIFRCTQEQHGPRYKGRTLQKGRDSLGRHAATRSAGLGVFSSDAAFSHLLSRSNLATGQIPPPCWGKANVLAAGFGGTRTGRPFLVLLHPTSREPHHGLVARESLASLDSRSAEPAARFFISQGGDLVAFLRTQRKY